MVSLRSWLPVLLGLVLLTVLEFRIVDLVHEKYNVRSGEAEVGILSGYPPLKVWQNRLMGPAMVATLSDVAQISYGNSYRLVCASLLLVANIICFWIFRKDSGSDKTAWIFTLIGAGFFIVLQDRKELHTWDYIGLSVSSLFAWAVFRGGSLRLLVLLFCIELLNRESALFIALWIIVDAFFQSSGGQQRSIFGKGISVSWKKLLTGFVLLALGIAWTLFLRETLLIQQTKTMHRGLQYVGSQFWMLPHTLILLRSQHYVDVCVALAAPCATIFLMVRAWSALQSRAWKIGVLIAALVGANFMIGVVTETRVWFALIPFWLWMIYLTCKPKETPVLAA